MPSFSSQMSGLAPWRRAVTIVLLILAIALLVLAVTGVIHTAAIVGAVVIVGCSYLVGPRSPFFASAET